MNIYKIMLLSLGLLMATKAGQAAVQQPNPVGLRCEFNGAIEVSLSQNTFEKLKKIEIERSDINPTSLYDAIRLCNMCDIREKDKNPDAEKYYEEYPNGTGIRRKFILGSNQWVWATRDTSIRLTLLPNPDIRLFHHRDVYFCNVFNKTLNFSLTRTEFEQFKNSIFIVIPQLTCKGYIEVKLAGFETTFENDANKYHVSLHPGQAIKYPGSSRISIMMETEK